MKNKTYNMWIEDVTKRHCDLYSVPKRYITSKMCLAAVRAKRSLYDINTALLMKECNPDEFITHYLCVEATRQNYRTIDSVPKKFLTSEMYLVAVQGGLELRKVPKKFLTHKMCFAAIKNNAYSLINIPEKFKSAELCLTAVLKNKEVTQYVPDKYKIYEFYLALVQKDGEALSSVPRELITLELCRIAVQQNSWALYGVPDKFMTRDIVFTAVVNHREYLRNTGDEHEISNLCLTSKKKDMFGKDYSLVPESIKTPEFLLAVAFKGYDILNHFRGKMPTGTFSALSQFLL